MCALSCLKSRILPNPAIVKTDQIDDKRGQQFQEIYLRSTCRKKNVQHILLQKIQHKKLTYWSTTEEVEIIIT